jgi:hypothetical protein
LAQLKRGKLVNRVAMIVIADDLLDNGNPAKDSLGGAHPAKPSTWGPMEEGRTSDAIGANEGPPAKCQGVMNM